MQLLISSAFFFFFGPNMKWIKWIIFFESIQKAYLDYFKSQFK